MYTTIADSLIAKGRAAGLATAVLRALELRWVTIPETIRERVASSRDEHQLQRWFDRVFTAASAEEALEALDG